MASRMSDITVRFYGRLAEQFGESVQLRVPSDGCTVAQVRALLIERLAPDAAGALEKGVRACVDDMFVPDSFELPLGAEVEFLPPLSGG
jgi:molybdopterin converting factor small subunit